MASKNTTIDKLVAFAQRVVTDAKKKKGPEMGIPTRTLSNVSFNKKKSIIELGGDKQTRYFFNINMTRKFMQTFLIANACKDLLKEKKTTSIRDLYYITKHTMGKSHENTFNDQTESDPIIEDLEVSMDTLREELNLFASNRGSMVGDMTLVDAGDTIDLRHLGTGGWSVPSIVEKDVIQFKKCHAKYILLVEKDAVWRRLNEDKYWRTHKCILLHGQGMAPRGVRRLVHRMTRELKLPLYVLTDNDPWGFYIYSVIKQGSINLAYESTRMAVPEAKFVGLSSFDKDTFNLPRHVMIKLDKADITRSKQILGYPWFQKAAWKREVRKMLTDDVKLELEALSAKGISFITEEYLPKKIRDKDWLD